MKTPKYGGVDVGGSKIEIGLFDQEFNPIKKQRRNTPKDNYEIFLSSLVDDLEFLRQEAGDPALPIGIGLPGIVTRDTGLSLTSNLPCSGMPLISDIMKRVASPERLAFGNDMDCFALSEVTGGAGDQFRSVFGLIIGTGLGGGFVFEGKLLHKHSSVAGEIGHIGIPAFLADRLKLPTFECGCGRIGCYETLVSGPGLTRLSRALIGAEMTGLDIARAVSQGDADALFVLDAWTEIAGEFLLSLQLSMDPNCIVLGGGLSNLPGVADMLLTGLGKSTFPGVTLPEIKLPKFGDSSGTRGAALLTKQKLRTGL